MRWWLCLVLAAGCGRFGFGGSDGDGDGDGDGGPLTDGGTDATADGPPATDAAADAPGDAMPGACRTNPAYVLYDGLQHRYRTSSADLSWTQARVVCAGEGAYLAIPNNELEASRLDGDWMGLTDVATEGQWRTIAGAPAPFLPWSAGEPSGGASKNCARLDDNSDLLEARECGDVRDYICECD